MMTEHLNIWVGTSVVCSIPMESDRQKAAGRKIIQGEHEANIFILMESEAREIKCCHPN